jgi:hypothetical protein
VESVELRETGRFVHVVTGPGSVLVLPAWMFDPVMCAGMTSVRRRLPFRLLSIFMTC